MAQPHAPLLQQMMLEFQNHRLESAERMARSILNINSKDLVALQVQGLCLAMQGRVAESVEPFTKAASLDAKNPELLSNLAKAQYGANLFREALKTYQMLTRLIPKDPQILGDMATCLAKLRDFDNALSCYKQAIDLQPDYFLVWSNLGNLFSEINLLPKAIESYERALTLNPGYAEAWTNYGNALFDMGLYQRSIAAHEEAIKINSDYAEAWTNYGNALLEVKRDDEAFVCYQKAYAIKPLHPYLMGQFLAAKQNFAIWDDEPSVPEMLEHVARNQPVAIPFILLNTPASLELQKKCAENYVLDRYTFPNQPAVTRKSIRSDEPIRIAYFSSDFKVHPVGVLMQNIIKLHDRSKFEVYGFFLNSETGDEVERSFKFLFDKSFNIFSVGDDEVCQLIKNQRIDVAIDLNGYTTGARTALFAKHIAPVQVSYLGFAGSSGSDFYDCIIADNIVIPHADEKYYSERPAYLPHSFFPVDTSIPIASFGPLPSRASQGLPNDCIVFACFNNLYKITPSIFTVWMEILSSVPESILWLSKFSDVATVNLRKEASCRGIDPRRLIFADRVPSRTDYLSRLRLADLFLDTPNYNAHTTAADSLWAGLPVLTMQGHTFAGRVAASQLLALGLPDLVVNTLDNYRDKAISIGLDPTKIKTYKDHIEKARNTSALFNTEKYVKDLEDIYSNLHKQKV